MSDGQDRDDRSTRDARRTVPSEITPEIFLQWRSPRRGSTNPQVMSNPLWAWLIEARLSAFTANELLHGPSPFEAGPMWCSDRFGQTITQFADGGAVFIGGEHEDHYDPDFYIYNDIAIVRPNAPPTILGYPITVFPPTDFHSATVVGNQIVLIGNLGYMEERRIGTTQVLRVDTASWAVATLACSGASPGWLHGHTAELQPDGFGILVKGGLVYRSAEQTLVENIDDWLLDTATWQWQRLTERRWRRFEMQRADRKRLHLFDLSHALWQRDHAWPDAAQTVEQLTAELGAQPRLDLVSSRCSPPIEHESLPDNDDEFGVHRIRIGDVVVKYFEDSFAVQVTIKGALDDDVVATLRKDLCSKLALLEHASIIDLDI